MHFIKIKTIHVLHKISFHNTIPPRSHSQAMLFETFDKFSSVLHFSTLKLLRFSCRKSLRFYNAHILKLCFFPRNVREKRKPKIITAVYVVFSAQV